MNFCPECGADLRSNPNAKFCPNCGSKLAAMQGVVANQDKNDVTFEATNSDNDFDYFDFPEERYFRDFMLEVMEHIQLSSSLSNEEISIKYFEKGVGLIEYIPGCNIPQGIMSIWNDDYSDDFGDNFSFEPLILQEVYSKVEDFYLNKFEITTSCFKASLFLNPDNIQAHYYQFICYHLCKNFDEAQDCLIAYAESARDLYGSDSEYLKEAGFYCNQYSIINQDKHNLKQLPSWILKYDSLF